MSTHDFDAIWAPRIGEEATVKLRTYFRVARLTPLAAIFAAITASDWATERVAPSSEASPPSHPSLSPGCLSLPGGGSRHDVAVVRGAAAVASADDAPNVSTNGGVCVG